MHLLRCLVFIEAHHYSPNTSTLSSIILLMICPVTIYPPFYPRYRVPTLFHPPHIASSWTCYWTHGQTGSHQPGAMSSAIFSRWPSPIDPKVLWFSPETLSASNNYYNVVSPFPVSEHLLCCFAAFLADQGLAPQTGKAYLAAVRSMQISLGLPDPREQSSLPILKRVQAGISRARMMKGTPPHIRQPITAHILGRIQTYLYNSAHPQKELLWAIACTAFFRRIAASIPEGLQLGNEPRLGRCSSG